MSSACFVVCPECQRLMIGQRHGSDVYPQPHNCTPTPDENGDKR